MVTVDLSSHLCYLISGPYLRFLSRTHCARHSRRSPVYRTLSTPTLAPRRAGGGQQKNIDSARIRGREYLHVQRESIARLQEFLCTAPSRNYKPGPTPGKKQIYVPPPPISPQALEHQYHGLCLLHDPLAFLRLPQELLRGALKGRPARDVVYRIELSRNNRAS